MSEEIRAKLAAIKQAKAKINETVEELTSLLVSEAKEKGYGVGKFVYFNGKLTEIISLNLFDAQTETYKRVTECAKTNGDFFLVAEGRPVCESSHCRFPLLDSVPTKNEETVCINDEDGECKALGVFLTKERRLIIDEAWLTKLLSCFEITKK